MNTRWKQQRERNFSIVGLSRKGKSASDIAAQFDLTRGRVRQIIAAHGPLLERRAQLRKRFGACPKINELADHTPIDVLILFDAKMSGWEMRIKHLKLCAVKRLGDLRCLTDEELLRLPHIGTEMLAQLRAFCPFRPAGENAQSRYVAPRRRIHAS